MSATGMAQTELQAAIFSTLSGDTALAHLLPGGLYDGSVPPEVKVLYPYVVIDSWTEGKDNRLATVGRGMTFLVHVFSDYYGFKEASIAGGRVVDLLNNQKPSAGTWNITLLQFEQSLSFVQQDDIRHLALRFAIKCQPIP